MNIFCWLFLTLSFVEIIFSRTNLNLVASLVAPIIPVFGSTVGLVLPVPSKLFLIFSTTWFVASFNLFRSIRVALNPLNKLFFVSSLIDLIDERTARSSRAILWTRLMSAALTNWPAAFRVSRVAPAPASSPSTSGPRLIRVLILTKALSISFRRAFAFSRRVTSCTRTKRPSSPLTARPPPNSGNSPSLILACLNFWRERFRLSTFTRAWSRRDNSSFLMNWPPGPLVALPPPKSGNSSTLFLLSFVMASSSWFTLLRTPSSWPLKRSRPSRMILKISLRSAM